MIRQYLVGVIFLGIAACTASGPEKPEPGTTAAAENAATSATLAESGEVLDENAPICKMVPQAGSLMKKKICMTAAEWKRTEEGGQAFMDKKRREDSIANPN